MSVIDVPESALGFGFANNPIGTHGSRTMMLRELRTLLSSLPASATLGNYGDAVIGDNVLLKNTLASRQRSFRALRELYRLDSRVLLFRVLRELWDWDTSPPC